MNPLIIAIVAVILIWLSALTFWTLRIFKHYTSLTKGAKGENLSQILNKVLERENLSSQQISDINRNINYLKKDGLLHIQKIGMLRFNPFNETGGDNSFTLCLLDGNSDGIVMTNLHTREKTRIYAKEIEAGKSKYELSKEEREAISKALK